MKDCISHGSEIGMKSRHPHAFFSHVRFERGGRWLFHRHGWNCIVKSDVLSQIDLASPSHPVTVSDDPSDICINLSSVDSIALTSSVMSTPVARSMSASDMVLRAELRYATALDA